MCKTNYCLGDDLLAEQGSGRVLVLPFEHHGHSGCHTHTFFEFVYIERGFTLHTYNNITTILTPGDLFAMKPGDVHGYTSAYHTRLYNCLFASDALNAEMDSLKELPGLSCLFNQDQPSIWRRIHLDIAGRNEVQNYLEKMAWECLNKAIGWELHLQSMLINFLVLFARAYNHYYKPGREEEAQYYNHVCRALSYIETGYKEDIFAGDIAAAAGLTADYLGRQFKHLTGLTTMEYLRTYRFAKAIELLRDQDMTVAQIAAEVGFDDPSYFTKLFKSLLGTSPSEYRRLNRMAVPKLI